jgi:CRISPR-associated Csx2 family protein
MHLYAFLGTNPYSRCRYSYEDSGYVSPPVRFVQTAVAEQLGDGLDDVTIFATPAAEKRNSQGLRDEFRELEIDVDPNFTEVPQGKNRTEMIQLFETLNTHLADCERAVFDITHGFRSQPLLGVLILNYVQSVRPEFELEDLVYGAFDLTEYKNNGESPHTEFPLVSLMPLWELNEWAGAFRTFEQTGDATALCERSNAAQDRRMRLLKGSAPARPELKTFAANLQRWQRHVELCAVPYLYGEDGMLAHLEGELSKDWNPFSKELGRFVAPLREKLRETIEPMSAPDWTSKDGLEAQLAVMQWMSDHDRYQSFLTMAREWLNVLMALALTKDLEELDNGFIGKVAAVGRNEESADAAIRSLQETFGSDFCSFVDTVVDARNAVNHCWIGRPDDLNAAKMVRTTADKVLERFPLLLREF